MQNYQPRMQKPLKWQHLAPCTLKFLMESASSLNISHIRVQTHFIYWKALSKWQMLEFEDFRTAASGIWKWVCWDKSKRRLRTVKSGWKSIVASSVCSTLCNTIVLQSITHSNQVRVWTLSQKSLGQGLDSKKHWTCHQSITDHSCLYPMVTLDSCQSNKHIFGL